MARGFGRIDGWWNELNRKWLMVRFPESWSSTPLANSLVLRASHGDYAFVIAFALIEGTRHHIDMEERLVGLLFESPECRAQQDLLAILIRS